MKDTSGPAFPVTAWSARRHDRAPIEQNHIEDGWNRDNAPTPNSDYQKRMWAGVEWFRQFGYLVDGRVVPADAMLAHEAGEAKP